MPRHATGLHAVQTGHQSVAPPRSATASRCAPSQGSRLLGIAPAPAAAPWFRPPESVGNHVNILSTTVVLGPPGTGLAPPISSPARRCHAPSTAETVAPWLGPAGRRYAPGPPTPRGG